MAMVTGFLVAAALAAGPSATPLASAQVVPTTYEAGHFYATPETADGHRLRLQVDTGGGGNATMYWISAAAAKRLGLKTASCLLDKQPTPVAPLPDYRPGHGLPPPASNPCGNALLVAPKGTGDADGQLGGAYLSGGLVWTFDYPAKRLIAEGSAWRPDARAHATPLGFQRDDKGEMTDGFARITLHVDGQPLEMLLDTGATAHPSAAGEKASGTPTVNGIGVASYITTSVMNRWHKAHPGWRVVVKGDDLAGARYAARLIEVPKVDIAGWTVGPVWFTERPDTAFHDFMSSMMDKRVEGAVGGNVFQHFVMSIDYPHATAYFRCVRGCKAAATPPPAP
ncbi:MAG: hypothetical protein EPN68_06705 [Rhodanobacter sp.]|nr:MAG: hypothetical protein EPN68_06705 [Rhodanobacter sp.]